ncbi:DNA oxidative demethylase AlkB [Orrella sp. JC864]|uniref:DNA oxidative demethylase AlkB n=1 Tax=Orrella sp. JC864 TaxID=3120298 RepID=UPI00300ADD95
MNLELFGAQDGARVALGPESVVLRGLALPHVPALLPEIARITAQSPWRQMHTPGGFVMSAALSNCGALGWTSDRRGYRYSAVDPQTGLPWPAMPAVFLALAREVAEAAGFPGFTPDACLINRYGPQARMSLHQDRNERDLCAPVVSVSLGMSAVFLFGGLQRGDKAARIVLDHGDVAVWGGRDRLRFHGVMAPRGPAHPLLGEQRINFTFRKAG